jgi:hypothetical protein
MSIKEAACAVMEQDLRPGQRRRQPASECSTDLYAARPKILALTCAEKLRDAYFTQTLLPDYIAKNPEQCADWDVVFGARGHFVEPHTGRSIPIGTLQFVNISATGRDPDRR